MNHGQVEQAGTPSAVYNHPATPFVYGFLGHVNLFHGRLQNGVLETGDIRLEAPGHGSQAQDEQGTAYVRPHDMDIERSTPADYSEKRRSGERCGRRGRFLVA